MPNLTIRTTINTLLYLVHSALCCCAGRFRQISSHSKFQLLCACASRGGALWLLRTGAATHARNIPDYSSLGGRFLALCPCVWRLEPRESLLELGLSLTYCAQRSNEGSGRT